MKKDPSWVAQTVKKFFAFYVPEGSLPLNSIYTFHSYFSEIHFNIIPSFAPRFPRGLFPPGFRKQNTFLMFHMQAAMSHIMKTSQSDCPKAELI